MAYAGACVSGFIIAYREHSALALEISNITISVLIGAYVSFSLLLKLRTCFLPMHLENSIPGSYSVVKIGRAHV